MLRGFFDDSRTDLKLGSPTWTVGGYIGDDHHWESYRTLWPAVLKKHDVPYFHGKEIMKPNGVYRKWHPLEHHKDEINAFMADLTNVITESYLRGVASIVRRGDLERFNAEYGLQLQPYPLAVYGCMLAITMEYRFEPMKLFFDHVEKVDSKLNKARSYADSDEHYREDELDRMALCPLPKGSEFGSKRIIELQAADLLAGDFRKNHLSVDEWFQIDRKPVDDDARHKHFEEWALGRLGTKEPPLRKSLQTVVDGSPHVPWVWDYDRLCEAHKVRGAPWP